MRQHPKSTHPSVLQSQMISRLGKRIVELEIFLDEIMRLVYEQKVKPKELTKKIDKILNRATQ